MPVIKTNFLTVKIINNTIKSSDSGLLLFDGNNLYLKKNANSITWYYRVNFSSNTGNKRTWLALGNYPQLGINQARAEAQRIKELINRGINPVTLKSKNNDRLGKPFGEVLEEYQQGYFRTISKNTRRNFTNLLRYAKPLRSINMETITEFDILEILTIIKKSGKDTIAKAFLQHIKKLFKYAYSEGYVLENRLRDLSYDFTSRQRERYLTPQELRRFMQSLLDDRETAIDIKIGIYSLLITMLRRSELTEITRQNINLTTGRVVVARTKTIPNFTLIIPEQLRKAWRLLPESGDLLFNYSDNTLYRNIVDLCSKYQIKRFTPHDMRRTATTLLAEAGYDYLVIDSALAHTIKGVSKNYLKSNLLDKRAELLQNWADYVDKLLGKKVVFLPPEKLQIG